MEGLIIHEGEQRSELWRDLRYRFFSATDYASNSLDEKARTIAYFQTFGVAAVDSSRNAVKKELQAAGSDAEDEARERMGLPHPPMFVSRGDCGFSPDALRGNVPVEFKSINSPSSAQALAALVQKCRNGLSVPIAVSGEFPHYCRQVQWQQWVMGEKSALLVFVLPNGKFFKFGGNFLWEGESKKIETAVANSRSCREGAKIILKKLLGDK